MSVLKQITIIAVLSVLGLVGWQERDRLLAFAQIAPADAAERPRSRSDWRTPVITETVTEMRDDLVLEVVGTGRARRSIMLRAQGSGEIVSMPLETQRSFPDGAVLMELDSIDESLALDLAKARLADVERTLARLTRLSSSGAAAEARLEEMETAVKVAQLQVERAREALADRTLRAPFGGMPGLPVVEPGAWVEEGDVIASFDDRGEILVEVDLPETALSRLSLGTPVTAHTPSAQGRVFDGEVVALDSRVDANSRTARIRVALPNPDDALRPGASFVVRLALPGKLYPAVPELAVHFSRSDAYVWRIVEGLAERVDMRLVNRRDGRVLLDGPLRPGDRVVVEGAQRLSPGRAVSADGRASEITS